MTFQRSPLHVLMHCNAGGSYGMGHLMRCLTLTEEVLRRGGRVTLAGDLDDAAIARVRTSAPTVDLITVPRAAQTDRLCSLKAADSADLVHIDSYWEESDAVLAAHPIVSNMQDGPFGVRAAALAIDANLGAEHWFDVSGRSGRQLAGSSATLVRDQARRLRGTWRATPANRILIVIGGTDPHGVTEEVIRALADLPHRASLTIVAPPARRDAILEAAAVSPHETTLIEPLPDLPAAAAEHDLVITAAGTSVWDFACIGVPMALVCVTENQRLGYEAALGAGLGIRLSAPPHADWSDGVARIAAALTDIGALTSLSEVGMNTVDGLGAWRIVSAWEELIVGSAAAPAAAALRARDAVLDDAALLFEWRNDSETRRMSRTNDELVFDVHRDWLRRTVRDPARRLLVIEDEEGGPVGTVRWDCRGDIDWEASITLAPAARGRGLSPSVLAAGESALSAAGPVRLLATIHADNVRSRRLFAGAGYFPHAPADDEGFALFSKLRLPG